MPYLLVRAFRKQDYRCRCCHRSHRIARNKLRDHSLRHRSQADLCASIHNQPTFGWQHELGRFVCRREFSLSEPLCHRGLSNQSNAVLSFESNAVNLLSLSVVTLLLSVPWFASACDLCAIYGADNASAARNTGFSLNISEAYIPYDTVQFHGEEVS